MKRFFPAIGLALLASSAPVIAATEAWALYDAFGSGKIDRSLWLQGEFVRSTNGNGVMRMMTRETGVSSAGGGVDSYSYSTVASDPSRITQLSAAVKVTALEVDSCQANGTASVARARLFGSFFNTGNPRVGSYYGDVLAQVVLSRASNSQDAPGLLRVLGLVNVCTDTNCDNSLSLGSVDLGTAPIGSWAFVQVEHDRANKRFVFGRDNGATLMSVNYTVSDSAAASRKSALVGLRQTAARCANEAPAAAIDAQFTKIRVNKSAL